MARRQTTNYTCPYCGKNAYGGEYSVTRRKTKCYFHKSCYMAEVEKNRVAREKALEGKR